MRSTLRGVRRSVLAALVVAAVVAGGPPARATGDGVVRLSVMTANILYGGDDYDLTTGEFCAVADGCSETLARVVDLIRVSGADVVGLQEPERNTDAIAQALGWHASARAHVISRFPIVDPPGSGGDYVFVEPVPGRVVAVGNVHLPSDPYGPYEVRDGAGLADVLDLEHSLRMPAIAEQLEVFPALAAQGIPAFLTGDFNSPSHLDWTAAVAAVRPEVRYPIDWPVSRALADAGLVDSFRAVHPDPVATPGHTWTPGGPESDPAEVFDRIDWVLSTGPARAVASTVIGEPGAVDAAITVPAPYPADHRAVVSTFDVTTAPMPVLVAVPSRSVERDDALEVRYHGEGRLAERVTVSRGGTVVLSQRTGRRSPVDGTVAFRLRRLVPGRYDVDLRDARGHVLSTTPVWVYRRDSEPSVTTDRRRYATGEPIDVSFADAPGMALDWIALYRCGEDGCDDPSQYLVYAYTRHAIEGSVEIGPSAIDGLETWPLPPGRYVARLLADDGYVPVAESRPFTITPP